MDEKPRNFIGQTVRRLFLVAFLWLVGGCSTGLVFGLIVSGGSHVAGLYTFMGIILGICGGIFAVVYVENLINQKRLLSVKSAAYIGAFATIPLDAMVIWKILTGKQLDGAALANGVLLILSLLFVGVCVSLCVRLVINRGLSESIGFRQA